MRNFLIVLILAAAGYFIYQKFRASDTGQAVSEMARQAREGDTAPAREVQGMVQGMERARDVQEQANEAARRSAEELQKALE